MKVYYYKDNIPRYCTVAGEYVSTFIRLQYKRKKRGSFYLEKNINVYYFRKTIATHFF